MPRRRRRRCPVRPPCAGGQRRGGAARSCAGQRAARRSRRHLCGEPLLRPRPHTDWRKGSGLTLAGEPPLTFVDSVLKAFPSPIRNASQVPDAVDVYRRVLAASPPRSVTIASVGLLTNLELLLRSGPDAHSPLDGPSPSSSSGLTRGEVLVTVSESLPCRLRFGGRKGGSPLNHGGRLRDERASLRRVQCVRLFQRRGRRLQGDRRSRVLFRRSKRAAVRPYHLPRVPRRGRGADWRGDGAVRSAGQPVPARPPRSEQSSSTRPRDQRHR